MNIPGMSTLTESASFLKSAVIQYFDPIINPQSGALVIVNLMGRCAGQCALSTALSTTTSTTTALRVSSSFISSSAMSARVFMAGEKKRNDPKFMSPLILNYPHLIKYASEELKDSFLFMGPLLKQHPHLIQHASKHLQESPLMRQAVLDNPALIEQAGFLQDDKEFMFPLIKDKPELIQYASERIRDIPQFMNFAISKNPELAQYASEHLKGDEAFMTAAIKKTPTLAKYASTELKSNPQFMLQVIKSDQSLIELGTPELFNNPLFMLPAIQLNPAFIQYAPEKLKGNPEFMREAVRMDTTHISHASKELKGNLEFMQFVATIDPIAAKEHATAELKSNPEFKQTVRDAEFMQVALDDLRLIEHCDKRFKDNEGFILRLIAKDPNLFPLASEKLRTSLAFVIKALKANPHILPHIDESFKLMEKLMAFVIKKSPSDRSLVEPIITKHPSLTQFITKELLDDPTMMNPLVSEFPETIQWAFPTLMAVIDSGSEANFNAVVQNLTQPSSEAAVSNITTMLQPSIPGEPRSPYLSGENLKRIYDLVKFIEDTAQKKPEILQYLQPCFLNNSSLMMSIINVEPKALQYLPKSAINNPKNLLFKQLLATGYTKQYLSLPTSTVSEEDKETLGNDRTAAAAMVNENTDNLKYIPKKRLNESAFMRPILKAHPNETLPLVGPDVLDDACLMLDMVNKDIANLKYIPQKRLNDVVFMRPIVKAHPNETLPLVGPGVLLDELLILDLAGTHPLALLQRPNLPAEWFDHPQFMDKILAKVPIAINKLGPDLKKQLIADVFSLTKEGNKKPQWMDFREAKYQAILNQADPKLLIELASLDYHILEYVPPYFLNDANYMLPVAKANQTALKYISSELESNEEFFQTLYAKHGPKVYSYASNKVTEKANLGIVVNTIILKTPERRRRNEETTPSRTTS